MKKYLAELLGTFVLTFFGCGSAAIAGVDLGNLGIAFAFGLSIVAMAYAIGNVSGCHINPAVSLGVYLTGRMNGKDLAGYIVAQVIGAIIAALLLAALISMSDFTSITATGLGANGYGDASAVGLNIWGNPGCQSRADKRGNYKNPNLGQSFSAKNQSGAEAPCGVNGSSR